MSSQRADIRENTQGKTPNNKNSETEPGREKEGMGIENPEKKIT